MQLLMLCLGTIVQPLHPPPQLPLKITILSLDTLFLTSTFEYTISLSFVFALFHLIL